VIGGVEQNLTIAAPESKKQWLVSMALKNYNH